MRIEILDKQQILNVSGVIGKAAFLFFDGRGGDEVKASFFQPYQQDKFNKLVTIVTSPLAFTCGMTFGLAVAAINIVLAIGNLLVASPSEAFDCIKDTGTSLLCSLVCLLLIPLSPIINLVDFIGSGIATARNTLQENPAP